MKAALITIGDEILNGQIVDSNSAWMARRLAALQISVVRITSVADIQEGIREALQQASERADLIITTGGLGPTKDDVTKEALVRYFGTALVRDETVLAHVKDLFSRFGQGDMPVANVRQADVLAGAEVLFNDVGTAPGMWMAHRGHHYVFLPGVPFEMEHLMENRVVPKLEQFDAQTVIHNAYLLVVGIGESHLAERIADIEARLPPHIRLAYLPKIGTVKLRLTARGTDAAQLRTECERFSEALRERLGGAVAALKDISLEQAIIERLKQQSRSLSTAESCTGGHISSLLTAVPGASTVFRQNGYFGCRTGNHRQVRRGQRANRPADGRKCQTEIPDGLCHRDKRHRRSRRRNGRKTSRNGLGSHCRSTGNGGVRVPLSQRPKDQHRTFGRRRPADALGILPDPQGGIIKNQCRFPFPSSPPASASIVRPFRTTGRPPS